MTTRRLKNLFFLGLAVSCSRTPWTQSPAPSAATPTPPTASGQPGTNAQPGGAPTGGPRTRPSRDSLTKLRAIYVAQVMKQIAGHENEPAEQVFKNIQV